MNDPTSGETTSLVDAVRLPMRRAMLRLLRSIRKLLRAMFPKLMHAYALSDKQWSEIEEDLLPIVVDRQRDAVDVGAYVGSYTVALAKLARIVYAFEPDIELANLLQRATPANVCVSHDAVSDRSGTTEFHVPSLDGRREVTLGSLVAAPERDCDVRIVRTTTLDGALVNSDVGFIKIDVEGAEQSVLVGGRQLIARCRPVVLVEANTPDAVAAVSAFFEPLGYAGFFVREGRTFGLPEFRAEMQAPQLLDEPTPRRQMRFLNNFFFAPSDAEPEIRDKIETFLTRDNRV
jgi:FkbM family methyltransferase